MADFLLRLQMRNGAIPDAPGWSTCNTDSNMEYALLGLAAAYSRFSDGAYANALRQGLLWLSERQTTEGPWRGSWFYSYDCRSGAPAEVSPGADAQNARGVDSTSALFLYLVWVYEKLTGDDSLTKRLEPNLKAALNFFLRARLPNGFFRSSWLFKDGRWTPFDFSYASDQGDCYLGLMAGWMLLGDSEALRYALELRALLPRLFDYESGSYFLGVYADGEGEKIKDVADSFALGYLPWVFGPSPENFLSLLWLERHQEGDGGFRIGKQRARLALPAVVYVLGMEALGLGESSSARRAKEWFLRLRCRGGGIRDSESPDAPCFSNLTGLALLALLGPSLPFPSSPKLH